MSLLLRQTGQKLLDDFSLEEYHLAISQSSKCLDIRDENNVTLMHFNGIDFVKMMPTKKEIAFSLDLLDKFFTKHWLVIKAYIDKKKVFEDKRKVAIKNNKISINCPAFSYDNKDRVYTVEYTDEYFTWTFTFDSKKKNTSTVKKPHIHKNVSPDQITEYVFDYDELKNQYGFISLAIDYNEEKLEIERLRVSLFKYDV